MLFCKEDCRAIIQMLPGPIGFCLGLGTAIAYVKGWDYWAAVACFGNGFALVGLTIWCLARWGYLLHQERQQRLAALLDDVRAEGD